MQQDSFFQSFICFTGQHRDLLIDTASFFSIKEDKNLELMVHNQSLSSFLAKAILSIENYLIEVKPDLVFVQGDTSSVLAGAFAAFYQKIPLAHLEAGLRSHDLYNPYPEEMNRIQTSRMATYHFAPTESAVKNLQSEGILQNVYNVGNTVVDALKLSLDLIDSSPSVFIDSSLTDLGDKKLVLVTVHRRENFGVPLDSILMAIKKFALGYLHFLIVLPVHPNPMVKSRIETELNGIKNIHLIQPLSYPQMIWMMSKSFFILTDSGGIQEEAPSLKKPVLVLREKTERQESIDAGTALLVGHDEQKIMANMIRLVEDKEYYHSFLAHENPYGDGHASQRIINILKAVLE